MLSQVLTALLEISGTLITAEPATDPSDIAEVWINNQSMNTEKDNGIYPMPVEGLTVEVEFTWNAGKFGADRITLIPPLGVVCEPTNCTILILEGFEGMILLKYYAGF